MDGYIHSTETFGTVDGPGIRYVVFLQGCPMRCLYCHNPDTWTPSKGEKRSTDTILADYERYRPYLKNGGITVTGGEPLMQIDFVIELFQKAKKKGIHTCLDTSGILYQPSGEQHDKYEELLSVTDLVMLDIKHIDPTRHRELTGQPNDRILQFAHFVADTPGTKLWIRHVLVPGITYQTVYLEDLGRFLATLSHLDGLEVLPYHTMGVNKYHSLGIEYPLEDVPPLTIEDAKKARNLILNALQNTKNTTCGNETTVL
ncbi:MAG: pyruvate formate-lyase-activating protein [Lachnospiraceae bacterium]